MDSLHGKGGLFDYRPIDCPRGRGMKEFSESYFPGESPVPGIELISCGKNQHEQWDLPAYRRLNVYALVFISQGSGSYSEREGHEYPVHEGDCILLFPGTAHRYGPSPGGWTQYWAVFSGPLCGNMEEAGYISPDRPCFSPSKPWKTQSDMEDLLYYSRKKPSGYRQQESLILYRMLLSFGISSSALEGSQKLRQELVERICLKLQEQLSSRKGLEEIISCKAYSYNYLRCLFKEETGQSPGQYLQKLRIQFACEELSFSDKSVKKISWDAGFDDAHYFSRFFRRCTGMSPLEYRKSIFTYR